MRRLHIASLAACCVVALSGAVALAADNWLGTWKLNVAKSKYSPGPAPKSLTLTWESTADGVKHTADGVNGEGNPMHSEYVTTYDGKEVAYTGNPDADMSLATRIDDNAYENVWKKDGKEMIKAKVVVSKDGKTMTITQTGKNAKGQTVHNTAVYDRQ
jgi:hypothetical protein